MEEKDNRTFTAITGDPRVYIHRNGEYLGWVDPRTGRLIPPVSIAETNAMLAAALKKKGMGDGES